MIGNDLIDLKLSRIQSNWQRPGLLQKIFSEREQFEITNSEHPELHFWSFWAMKEAAYKAHQRAHKLPRHYSPKDYNCEINADSSSGKVRVHSSIYSIYSIRLTFEEDFIHCLAIKVPDSPLRLKIFTSPSEAKLKLIEAVAEQEGLSGNAISLKKDKHSVPHLMYQKESLQLNFSLSHHGNFSAFVLALTNC